MLGSSRETSHESQINQVCQKDAITGLSARKKKYSCHHLCNAVLIAGINQLHNIDEIYNVHLYQLTNFLNITRNSDMW